MKCVTIVDEFGYESTKGRKGMIEDERDIRSEGRRKLSREERQLQLIEATISTIATHGYARTTMGEVARTAGLSHGLVNFHFETKEKLLSAVLRYLSDEYRENWQSALEAAPKGAPDQLAALLLADFDPKIITPDRLSAWCSFWGEAQSRPMYQDHCSSNDLAYTSTLESLCQRMNDEHGYAWNAARAARVLRVTTEGVWLDLMTMSEPYGRDEALATVWACAAAFFPRHFGVAGLLGA
jgi:TetR/AcrR family transcriptional repressor of bet genes